MRIINQYSRLSHHTNTTGLTFSVPTQDTNMQLWDSSNLALSEIGVDEAEHQVYIRIDDQIHQFAMSSGVSNDISCCDEILGVLGTMSSNQDYIIDILNGTQSDCCDEIIDVMTYVIGATLSRVDDNILIIDDKVDAILAGLRPIYITYSVVHNTNTTNYVVIETTKYVYVKDPSMNGKTSSRTINFGSQRPYAGWFPTNDGSNWYFKETNFRRYYSPDPFGGSRMITEGEYIKLFQTHSQKSRPYDFLGPDYIGGEDFNLKFTKNIEVEKYPFVQGQVLTIGTPGPHTKPLYPGYDVKNPKKSLRKFKESTSNYKSGLSKDGKSLSP